MGSRGARSGRGGTTYPGGFEKLESDLAEAKSKYNKRYNFNPKSDIYKQFAAYKDKVDRLQKLYDKEKDKAPKKKEPKKQTWGEIEKKAEKWIKGSKYYYTVSRWEKGGKDRAYINFKIPGYRNYKPGGYWDMKENKYVPPKSGIDLSKE